MDAFLTRYRRHTLSLNERIQVLHLVGDGVPTERRETLVDYVETMIRRRMAAAYDEGIRDGYGLGTGWQLSDGEFELQIEHAFENPYR